MSKNKIEFVTISDIEKLPKEDLYWVQVSVLDFIFDLKMKLKKITNELKQMEIRNAINRLINFSLEIEFKMIQLGI